MGEKKLMPGLYRSEFEHEACGVNFVADLKGRRSHHLVALATGAAENMTHRGATGSDPDTGDGAGILLQVPDRFLRAAVPFELPPVGRYATGIAFFPDSEDLTAAGIRRVERIVADEGLEVLGWREVQTDPSVIGSDARRTMPAMRQVFIDGRGASGMALERRAYVVRKRIEHEVRLVPGDRRPQEAIGGAPTMHEGVYFASLSARTLIYKGMLTGLQLPDFFIDLHDDRVESAIALVHARFSTNTFPMWPLAHPYRMIAHNGEINTIQGNRNFMKARESLLATDLIPDLERVFPVCTPGVSDTAGFDEVLELLYMGGYSLPEAVLMMIPEPWENHESMDPAVRDFYRYHASLMEPWDGPASIAFTDGRQIGAVLDRNGLRPSRYWVSDDDLVVMASEVGVTDVPQSRIVEKGRLRPGRMFLVDTVRGRIVRDVEIKRELATARPYTAWLGEGLVRLRELPEVPADASGDLPVLERLRAFGYTHEELKMLVAPMAAGGEEALGSMGTDTPPAVLSDRSRLLFDYFKQLFAQVTNPPLDAIREKLVTSMRTTIGPESNLFRPGPDSCNMIELDSPVIDNGQLASLLRMDEVAAVRGSAAVVSCHFSPDGGGDSLREALEGVCAEVDGLIESGVWAIVLSDRDVGPDRVPIPSLLVTAAVHHHLIRTRNRTRIGLIVETGDAREVHHLCLLLGYGATAVNPYMAFAAIDHMIEVGSHGLAGMDPAKAHANYVKAAGKGILKVMSKMGISTIASYIGAQIFEAVGDRRRGDRSLLHRDREPHRGRIGLDVIAAEAVHRHRSAFADNPGRDRPPRPGRRGRVPVAAGGGAPPVQSGDGVQAPALDASGSLRPVQRVLPSRGREGGTAGHPPRSLPVQDGRTYPGTHRRGGAGIGDNEAVHHRRHVLRLHLQGGARDPRHRHEQDRRQVQHRGGWRGPGPQHPRPQR